MAIAVSEFRARNGLDTQEESQRIWLAQLGHLVVALPNFKWRRAVIARHDAHHMITGYPTSASGELQIAAWELGVGCYDHWAARGLCSVLMGVGLLFLPRRTLKAYWQGKQASLTYRECQHAGLLSMTVGEARLLLKARRGQK